MINAMGARLASCYSAAMAWHSGEVIVWREVLNDGRPWAAHTVYVVEDTDKHLVTYIPTGTPFGFAAGEFPTPDGKHPWQGRAGWTGHGRLAIQRPDDDCAVFVFWHGAERSVKSWYINLQEAFRRTPIGFDTQDLELDLVVELNGTFEFKDADVMAERIAEGRFDADQVAAIEKIGDGLADRLRDGQMWWDSAWAGWIPDPSWTPVALPAGWVDVPTVPV
jgi:hypothetical protein